MDACIWHTSGCSADYAWPFSKYQQKLQREHRLTYKIQCMLSQPGRCQSIIVHASSMLVGQRHAHTWAVVITSVFWPLHVSNKVLDTMQAWFNHFLVTMQWHWGPVLKAEVYHTNTHNFRCTHKRVGVNVIWMSRPLSLPAIEQPWSIKTHPHPHKQGNLKMCFPLFYLRGSLVVMTQPPA